MGGRILGTPDKLCTSSGPHAASEGSFVAADSFHGESGSVGRGRGRQTSEGLNYP